MKITNRKEIKIEQGSPEWEALREQVAGGASEAPAMLGVSKYTSRNELLESKKGIKKEHSDYTKAIFAKGHELEEKARAVLEISRIEDFPPKVFSCEIDGLILLASLDGITEDNKIIFEHKSLNKDLAENVKKKVLEDHHSTQLDQQLLVTGAEKVIFVCSDGTSENWHEMEYTSTPEKFERIVEGWKQFYEDLDKFELKAKITKVEIESSDFPVMKHEVQGSLITASFEDYKPALYEISNHVFELIEKEDKTDLDFARLEEYVKAAKKERKSLKETAANVEAMFESFAKFNANISECDSILQKMSSKAEKNIKEAKESIKEGMRIEAQKEYSMFVSDLVKDLYLNPVSIIKNTKLISEAGKGKKTIDSFRESVQTALAESKINTKKELQIVSFFINYLESKKDHAFLFNDSIQLIESNINFFGEFKKIVDERIDEYKEEEKRRVEEAKRALEEKKKQEEEKLKEIERVKEATSVAINEHNNRISVDKEEELSNHYESDCGEDHIPEDGEITKSNNDSIYYECGLLVIKKEGEIYNIQLDPSDSKDVIANCLDSISSQLREK